jgi:hypothetical protein
MSTDEAIRKVEELVTTDIGRGFMPPVYRDTLPALLEVAKAGEAHIREVTELPDDFSERESRLWDTLNNLTRAVEEAT